MWGSSADVFQTRDKVANGWGTYVSSKLRGKGVSKEIRKIACKKLKEMGFDVVIGSTLNGNEEGENSTEKFGFKKQASIVQYSLKES
jgi:L-amino acid N-acyltransferase YncA